MSKSLRPINRISISELPEALSLKDSDYLILQSGGISSRIQITDFKLGRANLTFYNEIVDLNQLTAENAGLIADIKTDITAIKTDVAAKPDTSDLNSISASLATTKNDLKAFKTATNASIAQSNENIATFSVLITEIQTDIASLVTRVTDLEKDQLAIKKVIVAKHAEVGGKTTGHKH